MHGRADDTLFPQSIRGYRLTIFTQLRQVIETMHQPEQMFQWLGSVITQSFDVSIVQFWTCESNWSTQPSARLRAMAYQDPSQPVQLIGEKVALIVEHICRGQHISFFQPVEQMFPHYLASLLKRYGLSYGAYCLADKNVRFPPAGYALSQESTSTGQIFLALLLLRYYPPQDLISTMSIILEQAIVVAESHGLLIPAAVSPDGLSPPQQATSQAPPALLPGLVPRKKQDARLLLSSNPFASPVVISDKQALRLYEAIDSHKTVAELCRNTKMTIQEAQAALQTLLSLQYIEIFTSEGGPADIDDLFNNR
jgi:hypothetical protein